MTKKLEQLAQTQLTILEELHKLKTLEREEIMTAAQVMDYLKISRATFNRLKKEEVIKVYTLRGGRLLCKKSEILESIDNGILIERVR